MTKILRTTKSRGPIPLFLVFLFATLVAGKPSANAASLQAARVTVVIKDVRLLSGQAAARTASVNDNVTSGTAVRTGLDSRAELTFSDLTITRLGANTVFSFNPEARNLDLGNGAVLVEVPKGAPALHIITASVTAGITGGTALFETHAGAPTKLLVLEGTGRLCSKIHPGECATALGGEMTMMTVDGRIIKPFKFDAALVFKTSKLVKDFPPLPNQDLILAVIDQQQAEQSGEASTPPSPATQKDPIDVISASVAASPPPGRRGPSPNIHQQVWPAVGDYFTQSIPHHEWHGDQYRSDNYHERHNRLGKTLPWSRRGWTVAYVAWQFALGLRQCQFLRQQRWRFYQSWS